MAADRNKEIVRRFISEVLSGGQLDRVDELVAPSYFNRAFNADLPAFKEMLAGLVAALPERRFDVEELIAEADAVVARFALELHDETPGFEPSKDGTQQLFRTYRAAFPDLRMEAEDVLASGDKVVARVRVTGTHQGEFMGMPATGRSVDVQLIDITRFGEDGRAREHWGTFDALGMMQQLGAIPAPAAA